MIIHRNISLKKYHTFAFDNIASYLFETINAYEIYLLKYLFDEFKIDYLVIGNGSKVIFKDKIVEKPIIYISKLFKEIKYFDNCVLVSSGTLMKDLISSLLKVNLGGFSKLYSIPGSIGGMVYMNASINEYQISDFIINVITLNQDNKIEILSKDDCKFAYRKSIFSKNKHIILYVLIKVKPIDYKNEILSIKNEFVKRIKSQEVNKNTCGSIFKNTNKYKAYELIKLADADKLSINNVKLSNKHSNFIINDNGASSDAIKLIKIIRKKVYDKTNIKLNTEVNILK